MDKRVVLAIAATGVTVAFLLGRTAGAMASPREGAVPALLPSVFEQAPQAPQASQAPRIPIAFSVPPAAVLVSGVGCDSVEGEAIHIHAQLQIYFNGFSIPLPAGLGFNGRCTYWLHTHTDDGVIHVESPVVRTFRLGQFLDIAGFPRFGSGAGMIAFVDTQDGKGFREFDGDYRDIPLTPHAVIAMGIGEFDPQPFAFAPNQ